MSHSEDESMSAAGDDQTQLAKQLGDLKQTDPDFYEFLQEHDSQLLDFKESSENDEDDGDDEAAEDSGEDEPMEVDALPTKEAFKKSEVSESTFTLSLSTVNKWRKRCDSSSPTFPFIIKVMRGFVYVVKQLKSGCLDTDVVDAVTQLCFTQLKPALDSLLGVKKAKKKRIPLIDVPSFGKVSDLLKKYLKGCVSTLNEFTDTERVCAIYKHLISMVEYVNTNTNVTRTSFKTAIGMWSESESEKIRVLAFIFLEKMVRLDADLYLKPTLQKMLSAYEKNTKFTTSSTLVLIGFMQHSLVQLLSIDMSVSYMLTFNAIKAAAITLRNALTNKKKEFSSQVYCWQFIHNLYLWATVLSSCCTSENEALKPLIYPLTEVIVGTIKLLPVARYYPARFHCVRILILLSKFTKVYIPIFAHITEVLLNMDFHTKLKKSIKPFNLKVSLRFSDSDMKEEAFQSSVIDSVYDLLLECFATFSHNIGSPELFVLPYLHIRKFVKSCKVSAYTQKMKQLLDKVEQNTRFIVDARANVEFGVMDFKAIYKWESEIENNKKLPLKAFHSKWLKTKSEIKPDATKVPAKEDFTNKKRLNEANKNPKKKKKFNRQKAVKKLSSKLKNHKSKSKLFKVKKRSFKSKHK